MPWLFGGRGDPGGKAALEQYLRISLKLGAAYDLGLGLVIILAGQRIMGTLGSHPDSFLLSLGALPLFLLPVLYWSAARAASLDSFRAPVFWTRGFGGLCILVLVAIYRPPQASVYILIGLLDGVWLGIHYFLWKR